jgi:dipeptidyl aminopeptidase/acylaminoacyl peptidase
MLKAPDVYHVGITGALVYVNGNSTHANIAESFLGLPAENLEVYKKLSILSLAKNLKGKLLLIQSSADHIAIFSHTMKLIDALIKAGKSYDLLILPDENHSQHSRPGNPSYVLHTYRRYFIEHLKPEIH